MGKLPRMQTGRYTVFTVQQERIVIHQSPAICIYCRRSLKPLSTFYTQAIEEFLQEWPRVVWSL